MYGYTKRVGLSALLCSATLVIGPIGIGAQGAAGGADPLDQVSGRGFFQVGLLRLDLDDLNSDLTGAGYPSFDRDALTLGGGGYGSHGRLLIGGEGHAILGGDKTTTDGARRLSLGGGYGLFRVGYVAVSRGGLDVFPLLGIGGGAMSISIAERSAPTFDEVLTDPERAANLSTGMFLMDLALGANYRIAVSGEDDDPGGFLIGVQVGYTFAPGSSSWTLDEVNNVAGGPELQIEGPYVRLSLGGWGSETEDDSEP
jgi:hypothetical protein